jgi:hypothetical protein
MFVVDNALRVPTLLQSELDVVFSKLSDPALVKYFNVLAFSTMQTAAMANPERIGEIHQARGALLLCQSLLGQIEEWQQENGHTLPSSNNPV